MVWGGGLVLTKAKKAAEALDYRMSPFQAEHGVSKIWWTRAFSFMHSSSGTLRSRESDEDHGSWPIHSGLFPRRQQRPVGFRHDYGHQPGRSSSSFAPRFRPRWTKIVGLMSGIPHAPGFVFSIGLVSMQDLSPVRPTGPPGRRRHQPPDHFPIALIGPFPSDHTPQHRSPCRDVCPARLARLSFFRTWHCYLWSRIFVGTLSDRCPRGSLTGVFAASGMGLLSGGSALYRFATGIL